LELNPFPGRRDAERPGNEGSVPRSGRSADRGRSGRLQEQNFERLLAQIKEARHDLLGVQQVRVEPEKIRRKKMGPVALCPVCGEPYPTRDGERCRNCGGETPYTEIADIRT